MKLGQWLGLLCLAIALVILWQVRQMLLLIFTAVVLATALNSLVRRFQKHNFKRSVAILMTLLLVMVVSILFISVIVPAFIPQFVRLVELLPRGFDRVAGWVEGFIQQQPDWFSQFELPSADTLTQQLQPLLRNVLQNFFAFFSNSLTVLLQLLLVLVLTVMLLANPMAYRDTFILLFPSFYRRRVDLILEECEIALGNWLGGVCVSSLGVALLSGIGLSVLQIDYVFAHALLAGLLNFIPNIGPTLSVVFPIVVALLDTPWKAIAVLGLYLIIQQIESYWITPTVMARQVSLLPAITLSAQIFFASFFGFLGLVLALPLTVVAKVWIQEALIRDVLDRWREPDLSRSAAITDLPAQPAPPVLPASKPVEGKES
jgi:predicted PurR-regulated permease PerM